MRLPVDMTGMSSTSAQIFVAGPRDLRTRRPARTCVGLILMSLMLTLAIQRVVIAAPRGSAPYATLQVQALAPNGHVSSSAHVIDVSGAYPGMLAKRSTFDVRNAGTMPLAFTVTSRNLVTTGARSLDDVLRIVVRDAAGHLEYRGRLSGLRIAHTGALAPQTAATFTVDVTWASGPADAAYEGAGLSFSIVASGSAP
jgi:hypothetical protein